MDHPTIKDHLDHLLTEEFSCSCGREHPITLRHIHVASGAMDALVEFVAARRLGKVFLIADCITHDVAGDHLGQALRAVGLSTEQSVLPVPLIPDEAAVETLQTDITKADPSLVIAVGSGTIHDLGRYVAAQRDTAWISFPTAPSVDGYASSMSPLIFQGIKKTVPATMPLAVFADTDILAQSPPEMIAAGFGDILGKVTAIADWRLSRVITDEAYCPEVAQLIDATVEEIISRRSGLHTGQPEAIESLIQGLLVTGLAIQMIGNSRPASGSEHHLSHYWEMRSMWSDGPLWLHGAKVGVGTALSAAVYERLAERIVKEGPHGFQARVGRFAAPQWERVAPRIQKYYGPLAELMAEEARDNYDANDQRRREKRIFEQWDNVLETLKSVSWRASQIRSLLNDAGASTVPADLGIPDQWVEAGLLAAKEVRPRYTVLQLAEDLGWLEEVAEQQ